MANAAAIAAAFGGGLPPGISGTNDRCTVLVSNLNPDVRETFLICNSKAWFNSRIHIPYFVSEN